MTTVETIRKVRLDFQKGINQRQIAKKRVIDRKTVSRIIKAESLEFKYSSRKQPSYPQLGKFMEDLDRLLTERQTFPKKKQCKLTRIHEKLTELGYEEGYDSIRRNYRT